MDLSIAELQEFGHAAEACAHYAGRILQLLSLQANSEDAIEPTMFFLADLETEAEKLRAEVSRIDAFEPTGDSDDEVDRLLRVLNWIEETSLDDPVPVGFQDRDFLTASQAAISVGKRLLWDVSRLLADCPVGQRSTAPGNDLRMIVQEWRRYSPKWFRRLETRVYIESRRAQRDWYRAHPNIEAVPPQPRRPIESDEPTKADLEEIRAVVAAEGREKKPAHIRGKSKMNNSKCRRCLRILEQKGEYDGFGRGGK